MRRYTLPKFKIAHQQNTVKHVEVNHFRRRSRTTHLSFTSALNDCFMDLDRSQLFGSESPSGLRA